MEKTSKYWILMIVTYISFFAFFFFSMNYNDQAGTIITTLICIFFGWNFLNKIFGSFGFVGPGILFLFLIAVKFMLSYVVGIFVAPYMIAKFLTDHTSL